MATPIPKTLPYGVDGGEWVLIVENILSATIQITADSDRTENYRKIYVDTGGDAPEGDAIGETKVIDEIIEIAHTEPIDVYMRYVGDNIEGGVVVVSA